MVAHKRCTASELGTLSVLLSCCLIVLSLVSFVIHADTVTQTTCL